MKRGLVMVEVVTLFLIMTVLLLAPLWVYYRTVFSEGTREHLIALLLHDTIKVLVRGLIWLVKGIASFIVTLFDWVKRFLLP